MDVNVVALAEALVRAMRAEQICSLNPIMVVDGEKMDKE